jgi:hypothetical protein
VALFQAYFKQIRGCSMAQQNFHRFKKSAVRKFESLWLFFAILALISSVMCVAVAFLALVLPGANMAMLGFLVASLVLGLSGRWSIRRLRKRGNRQFQLFI